MKLTIEQLLEVHTAMSNAMVFMDEHPAMMVNSGQYWHRLNNARNIIRVAIESTGATVEIEGRK